MMQRMLGDENGFTEEAMERLANELIMCVAKCWEEKIEADRFLSDEARESICNYWDDKFDVEPGDWQKFPSQHTDVELVQWLCERLLDVDDPTGYEEYRHVLANDRALAEYVKHRPVAIAERDEWRRKLSGQNS